MTAVADEEIVLKRLAEEGWNYTGDRRAVLRMLAFEGDKLRKRYENSCNYVWATSDAYDRRTEFLEKELHKRAHARRLTLYLQRDPRGATVYVRPLPHVIDDSRYSTQAQCLYFKRRTA